MLKIRDYITTLFHGEAGHIFSRIKLNLEGIGTKSRRYH